MYALLSASNDVVGLYETREHAEEQIASLGLLGVRIEPVSFQHEPGRLKLQVKWTLEKFEGDEQTPEKLLETINGEF